MFAFFERQLKPTQTPERPEPPASLLAFYWHYAREARRLFIALFAAGFVVALLDTMIPVFIGRVVTLLTSNPPDQLFEEFGSRGLVKARSDFSTEQRDGAAWKVFFVVAPDGLCYWFGERQPEDPE